MSIIESVIEKKFADGKEFWVAIIDGKEIPCYDPEIKAYKGKENPFQIALSAKGKEYLKVPKAGGFKPGGGFQRGKSDKEIYAGILTMLFAYSKDEVVPMITSDNTVNWVEETTLRYYRTYSKAVLADLKALCPDVPKPTEAPKTETKAHEKPPQETSPPQAGKDTGTLTAKENLRVKMKAYLKARNADTDNAFKALLVELTEFPGKNRETGELTGKMVFIDDIDDKKFSDKWALTSYGKLKALIEQDEQRGANDMDDSDIRY